MITDDTLVALRNNDQRLENLFFYLDDWSLAGGTGGGNENNDHELLQAIRGNTRVNSVDIDMHVEDQMTSAIAAFMTEVGRMTNLQRLRCSSSGTYAITMAAMAKAIESSATTCNNANNSSKLTSLDLANFLLCPEHQDEDSLALTSYPDFCRALRNHSGLKKFNLGFGYATPSYTFNPGGAAQTQQQQAPQQQPQQSGCISKQDEASDSEADPAAAAHCCLTPLLDSLSTCRMLVSIRLDGAGAAPRGALTPLGLSALLSTTNLATLELAGFEWSLDHVVAMTLALTSDSPKSNLKVLSLDCRTLYHESTTSAVAANHKSFPHHNTKTGASCVAQIFQHNTTLETLSIPLPLLTLGVDCGGKNKSNDTKWLIDVFQALETNATLKRLSFTNSTNTASTQHQNDLLSNVMNQPESVQAFRHLLQHNYALDHLQIQALATQPSPVQPYVLPFTGPIWQAEIDVYMKLNSQAERGKLVRDSFALDSNTTTTTTTRSQWIDAFGRAHDDLSCIYHLLLLNPLLCE